MELVQARHLLQPLACAVSSTKTVTTKATNIDRFTRTDSHNDCFGGVTDIQAEDLLTLAIGGCNFTGD